MLFRMKKVPFFFAKLAIALLLFALWIARTLYLKRFALPSVDVAEVHFTDNDVLQTIPITCVGVAQGSKIKGGRAYLPDGDSPGNYWLHVVDLATGQEVRTIDLNPIGLEPEGVDVRGGWIYVSFNTPDPKENKIYRFRR